MRILFKYNFWHHPSIRFGGLLGAIPQPVEAQKEMACLGRLYNYYRCVVRCHPILLVTSSGFIRHVVLSANEYVPY